MASQLESVLSFHHWLQGSNAGCQACSKSLYLLNHPPRAGAIYLSFLFCIRRMLYINGAGRVTGEFVICAGHWLNEMTSFKEEVRDFPRR